LTDLIDGVLGRVVRELSARARRPVDVRLVRAGWSARLNSEVDAQNEAFERELEGNVELPLQQRLAWVLASPGEHRCFQLRDASGRAVMQAIIRIGRPRRMPQLAVGVVSRFAAVADARAEERGIQLLRDAALEARDLVELRLQAYRGEPRALLDFEAHARRSGFRLVDPVGVTRTLTIDLTHSVEELLGWFSKKTRARVRHRSRDEVLVRPLTDARYIPACVEAANASLARTHGGTTRFDFQAVFALAAAPTPSTHLLGLFLPERPDELLAFVSVLHHGAIAEYSAAGSLAHPQLRSMPYYYWMLWDLICWARLRGAKTFDLGGVTDGGPEDNCAGISQFKRHFSETEVELGREMSITLQPTRGMVLDLWRARSR